MRHAPAVVILVGCLSSGCGDDVDATSTSTGATTGGSMTTGAGGGGTGGMLVGAGGVGSVGGGGTGGEGGDVTCGGFAGDTCSDDQYCDFPDDQCGAADGSGVCIARPDGCPLDVEDLVCGCNGEVFSQPCLMQAAGFDRSILGTCTPPGGSFACGSSFCSTAAELCVRQVSDVGGEPDTYTCNPLPAPCDLVAVPTCTCAAEVANACGGTCTDGDGVTVTCPGG